jgi:hypothetical protein
MKRLFVLALVLICSLAAAQSTARVRGVLEKVDAKTISVKQRDGDVLAVALPGKLAVNEAFPISISAIQPGSYIGTAAMPKPDGSLEAIEVLVFPEAARGTAEGHRPWDLQPGSTMTNATVEGITSAPRGRTVKLRYKDGEQTVHVAESAPIVTVKPADATLLVPGAKVVVFVREAGGKPLATQVIVGRDGYMPPM